MSRFNVRVWSYAEDTYLREHGDGRTPEQLAIDLARTTTSVRKRIRDIGSGSAPTYAPAATASICPAIAPRSQGFRQDLRHSVRSGWEANFARVLIHLGIPYEYEKYSFRCDLGKTKKSGKYKGVEVYIPDFYLPDQDLFVEVKGFLPAQGKRKIAAFKKCCPAEFAKLYYITANPGIQVSRTLDDMGVKPFAYYSTLRFDYWVLPGWEQDKVSASWVTSKRKRICPGSKPPPFPPTKLGEMFDASS